MNCLLKYCAFCLSVMAVCWPNVIVVFVGGLVFLFERSKMVFQSLCVSFLWLQSSVRCCFQSSCLCCWISVSICVFSVVMFGCSWSCSLRVFRCSISSRMCSGSSLYLFLIFPCGI